MKNFIKISILIILCCLIQAGCADRSEEFNPYQSVISLEQSIDKLDESTLQTLRNKLILDLHKPTSPNPLPQTSLNIPHLKYGMLRWEGIGTQKKKKYRTG